MNVRNKAGGNGIWIVDGDEVGGDFCGERSSVGG